MKAKKKKKKRFCFRCRILLSKLNCYGRSKYCKKCYYEAAKEKRAEVENTEWFIQRKHTDNVELARRYNAQHPPTQIDLLYYYLTRYHAFD